MHAPGTFARDVQRQVTAVLPIATTTIAITRPQPADDPYDAPGIPDSVDSGVRATIGAERGRTAQQGTQQETVSWRLDADLCDLIHGDIVTDERTGDTYRADWVRPRAGLGLDHIEASLTQVSQRSPVGA